MPIAGGDRSSEFIYHHVKTYGHSLALKVNEDEVPARMLRTEGTFKVYAANISRYAGREVTLTFCTLPSGRLEFYVIDSISFESRDMSELSAPIIAHE